MESQSTIKRVLSTHSRLFKNMIILSLLIIMLGAGVIVIARPHVTHADTPSNEAATSPSPAQYCLYATLINQGWDQNDPDHAFIAEIEIQNNCGIDVKIVSFDMFYRTSCPVTSEAPYTNTTLYPQGNNIVPDGGLIVLSDTHTEHCVECHNGLAIDWPSFSVFAALDGINGVNTLYNGQPPVYMENGSQPKATFRVQNSPPDGAALCNP